MCTVLVIPIITLLFLGVLFQLLEMMCIKQIQNQSSNLSSTGFSYILVCYIWLDFESIYEKAYL